MREFIIHFYSKNSRQIKKGLGFPKPL